MPRRPGAPSGADLAAAAAMLIEGNTFARYRHAVALIDGAGALLAANPAGRALAEAGDGLARLAAAALGRGEPQVGEIARPCAGALVEANAVPLGTGFCLIIGRDITAERSLRAALVESRRRYKDLVEISSDFAWETDAEGRFTFVSTEGALGYAAEALVGRTAEDLLAEPREAAAGSPFRARAPSFDVYLWLARADGRVAAVVASALPVFDDGGAWRGARGLCRDVSAMHDLDAALARVQTRERLLAYVIGAMREETAPARALSTAAAAIGRALGGSACLVLRAGDGAPQTVARFGACPDSLPPPAALFARAHAAAGEVVADAEHGLLLAATAVNRSINGALVVARAPGAEAWAADERALAGDVAVQVGLAIAQLDSHARLEALSRTDGLTGLLNRRAFEVELAERLARVRPSPAPGTLLYVDLDNFKPVNDRFGHKAGDAALVALAAILRSHSRPGDLVGRLGGDEFALWLERTDCDIAERRAEVLTRAAGLALARFTAEPAPPPGISVGIALCAPESGETASQLIARADGAMYAAKRRTKGGHALAPQPETARQ